MSSVSFAKAVDKHTMTELGQQAGRGELSAVDRIGEAYAEIYKGIDLGKDRERVDENLVLMRSAFETLSDAINLDAPKNPALYSLLYALEDERLMSFATYALGRAAARGHEPSLKILLNYKEREIVLSSVVFALREVAENGNDDAIKFLLSVVDDDSKKPLWHGATSGLKGAAEKGNPQAKAAIQKYLAWRAERAERLNTPQG